MASNLGIVFLKEEYQQVKYQLDTSKEEFRILDIQVFLKKIFQDNLAVDQGVTNGNDVEEGIDANCDFMHLFLLNVLLHYVVQELHCVIELWIAYQRGGFREILDIWSHIKVLVNECHLLNQIWLGKDGFQECTVPALICEEYLAEVVIRR